MAVAHIPNLAFQVIIILQISKNMALKICRPSNKNWNHPLCHKIDPFDFRAVVLNATKAEFEQAGTKERGVRVSQVYQEL